MCFNDCCCCDKGSKDGQNLTRRSVCCTDIIFLIIFLAFWGGMAYIAAFTIQNGDAYRIMYGYDSFGNTCNDDNTQKQSIANLTKLSGLDLIGKSKVFFMDVLDPVDSMEICIQSCPKKMLTTKQDVKDFYDETETRLCRYDVKPEDYVASDDALWSKLGPCPKLPVFASISLLSRCMPDPIELIKGEDDPTKPNVTDSEIESIIAFLNADDIFRQILSDLYTSWKELLYLCLIALGLSFTMVLLIRYVASILVWVVVILAAVGSIFGTGVLWWTWYELKHTKRYDNSQWEVPILSIDVKNEQCFLGFAITATVLTFFLLLVILVMRSRLALVVTLFHEAGKCLVNMPLMLIQPLWTFICILIFLAYWLIVLAFIVTTGEAYADESKGFDIPSVEYNRSSTIEAFFWYHLVGLIWTSEFILACQQFVIAAAVSSWFFTREKSSLSCTLTGSVGRLIFHHIGTVAFGSFIITLVKIPRYILMYIHAKCDGSESIIAKAVLKCCICCLWCLEKLLKFLNQNAYTIVAIEGKSFCPAAKRAFGIIASNILRVAAINSVGAFVLFLGKIGVMAATCAISVIWLKQNEDIKFYAIPVALVTLVSAIIAHCMFTIYDSNEDLHFFAIPVLLVSVVAYIIADCFLTVYEMVIDTLLLCFCEDCQLNDGSEEKPYFMSTSLMDFVSNSKAAKKNAANAGKVDSTEMDEKK